MTKYIILITEPYVNPDLLCTYIIHVHICIYKLETITNITLVVNA